MRRALLLVAIAACGFGSPPIATDASGPVPIPRPDAYECVHVHLDAGGWGESCSGSLCHDDLGWCIDGACRPQCVQPLACLACEGTGEHFSPARQCYCAP